MCVIFCVQWVVFYPTGECLSGMLGEEKLAIGIKQSKKAVASEDAKYVIVAKDAENSVLCGLLADCTAKGIEVREAESMSVLGESVGIDVGSSVVAVLK